MLARGSEFGLMRFMTCRICVFSSPTSWMLLSSTDATRTRPDLGQRLKRYASAYKEDRLTVQTDNLGCKDHLQL
nr:hypothetical protein CFP56_13179 [Quercus suber]